MVHFSHAMRYENTFVTVTQTNHAVKRKTGSIIIALRKQRQIQQYPPLSRRAAMHQRQFNTYTFLLYHAKIDFAKDCM